MRVHPDPQNGNSYTFELGPNPDPPCILKIGPPEVHNPPGGEPKKVMSKIFTCVTINLRRV